MIRVKPYIVLFSHCPRPSPHRLTAARNALHGCALKDTSAGTVWFAVTQLHHLGSPTDHVPPPFFTSIPTTLGRPWCL